MSTPKRETMTDYEVLKRSGHSPAKAAEIALDAKRGDKHAVKWLAVARSVHRGAEARNT